MKKKRGERDSIPIVPFYLASLSSRVKRCLVDSTGQGPDESFKSR